MSQQLLIWFIKVVISTGVDSHRFFAVQVSDAGITSQDEARLLIDDVDRDIALLLLTVSSSNACVIFKTDLVSRGASCACLGFPFAHVDYPQFDLCERFQHASISTISLWGQPGGRAHRHYEIDRFLYKGASGGPVFLASAEVIGMVRQGFEAETIVDDVERGQQTQAVPYPLSIVIPSTDIISLARLTGINL